MHKIDIQQFSNNITLMADARGELIRSLGPGFIAAQTTADGNSVTSFCQIIEQN
ncbi:MAG: hypothetical protein MJK10_11465 [Pseudomonadales bacterium]|nr:hypothetical protein [Pseudomonadales bacterium]NRA16619.1 hypothetical protein [Oceanospirillaceae bacterium]